MEIYTVKQGDTVFSIAEKYGVSVQRIISDNGLINPQNLVVGQSLLILFPSVVHTVKQGETLASIATFYGKTTLELYQNNPYLTTQNELSVGQNIVISYDLQKEKELGFSGFIYENINLSVLEFALPFLTSFAIFGYGFNDNATIISLEVADITSLAKKYKAKVLLSLTFINPDGSFGEVLKVEKLFTDKAFQNRVISGIIGEITRVGADGLDIDMEYIPPEYKEQFVDFVENAGEQVRAAGYILQVCLAPKTFAEQKGLLYESHDYAKLGAAADQVFLMTYEWGYKFGPPLAIAPINSVTAVLEYALTEIPAKKIILGMPNYAYDWELPFVKGETAAETFGNLRAVERASFYGAEIIFDEQSASPNYSYENAEDKEHIVWFEDVSSMNEKYNLISSKNIAGGGYWNLMRPFPQGFLLYSSRFEIKK